MTKQEAILRDAIDALQDLDPITAEGVAVKLFNDGYSVADIAELFPACAEELEAMAAGEAIPF